MVRKDQRGFTLTEALIVVAIIGAVASIGAQLMPQITRFFILGQTRVELQREARAAISLITKNLRQAQFSTIRIDQAGGQPYYSRISFTKMQGTPVTYSQSGKNLIQTSGALSTTLSKNVRYLAFTFPRSDDMTILSVSITLEKGIYEGLTKALHVASEKVQVMN